MTSSSCSTANSISSPRISSALSAARRESAGAPRRRRGLHRSPDPFFHLHEIDDPFKLGPRLRSASGPARRGAGAVLDHVNAVEEVRADLVHLVDEHDPRNLVAVGLAPDGLGLRLDARIGIQHADCTVEHGQRTLDLDGEVDVAGRVDDVEAVLLGRASSPSSVRSQNVVVAAEVIVIPRSCSCSIQSMVAAPSWTSPILCDFPV